MKKWFAILAVLVLLLSGCAKADLQPGEQPQNPVEEDQVVIEKLPELEPILAEKDSTITDEQRKLFFDLVKEYRVDAMPEFSSGNPIELERFKYYCAYFVEEDEKTFVSGGVNYTGAAVERIAKRFGMSYGLKDDDQVFVTGSLMPTPFAELIQSIIEKNKKEIILACQHYLDEYAAGKRPLYSTDLDKLIEQLDELK